MRDRLGLDVHWDAALHEPREQRAHTRDRAADHTPAERDLEAGPGTGPHGILRYGLGRIRREEESALDPSPSRISLGGHDAGQDCGRQHRIRTPGLLDEGSGQVHEIAIRTHVRQRMLDDRDPEIRFERDRDLEEIE